jgi:protein-tyrosine phosphatase
VTEVVTAWIELDGVVNMRDVGGIPTADGARVLPGRLLRSDNLQDLSPDDVAELRRRGVSDVVDLRADLEAAATGPGPLTREPWVRVHQLSLFDEGGRRPETSAEPPGPEPVETEHDPSAVDRALVSSEGGEQEQPWGPPAAAHYVAYLEDRPDSVVAALRVIAGAEGAVIVHCAAGKDRTGTIVAIALLLVGAAQDAVLADYAASSERIEQIMGRLLADPVYAEVLRGQSVASQTPDPAIMRAVLRHIAPGGDTGPLRSALAAAGWTDADTARLRAKLLG